MVTLLEVSESFYKQLGWTTVRQHVHQPSSFGNTVPITAIQMEKLLDVK